VTVTGTATDPSGVASVTVNGEAMVLGADGSFGTTLNDLPHGENQIEITATDMQGNSVTIRRTVVVLECENDEPPVITAAVSPAANGYGWNNTDVTVTFSATDDSEVVSVTAPQTLTEEGALQSVTGTATDDGGNSSSITVSGISIDKTAPDVTGSPDRAPNANGWYSAPVLITFTSSDALSGIDTAASPVTLAGEGAGQSASGTSTDKAGNSATATVSGINIDLSAPVVLTTQSLSCIWPPNHKMVPVTVGGQIADLSGGQTIQGFTITSNEPDDSKGDGKSIGDCNGQDGYTSPAVFLTPVAVAANGTFSFNVNLRAERQGGSTGRVYTISWNVADLAGNTTPVSVTVCVPHNQ